MTDFEVVGTRRVYEGVLSSVRIDTLRGPDGAEFEREVVEHVDAVGVVPVDAQGRVVCVRQHRHPVGVELLEVPAGIRDVDGEPAATTAVRELAEEAGLAADDLLWLTTIHPSAGWTDEATALYLATGLREALPPEGYVAEAEEARLRVVRLPLAEAADMAADGRLTDAKTAVGVLAAARRLGR